MKKFTKTAIALLCAVGGEIFASCSGGTTYVGTDSSSSSSPKTNGTYKWSFSTADLVTVPTYDVTGTTEISKGTLQAAATYESTPAGLTMNLAKDSYFNKVSPSGTVSSSYSNISSDASAGYVEPDGSQNTELTVSVKGPFTATMLCGANSSSDKTDRYAYIKVDGAEVAAPNKSSTTLSATGEKLTYSYTGTDTVTVAFGSTKIVRIFDIIIETENGDAAGKVAGEVVSMANFASQTKNVTNDAATLGFVAVGTPTSSDSAVATAEISGENVVITSKKAGSATITVSDGTNSTTIAVTVGGTGAITATPTKWTSGNGSSVYTLGTAVEASKFASISTKTTAVTTPTSTDSETTAIITALELQLGEGMRVDGSPQRFNIAGSLQKAGKNAIIFTAPAGASSIEVHFYNNGGSAGDRYLQISEYSDSAVSATAGTKKTVASSTDDIVDSFTITAGKKYMLGASNGLYITKFIIN